MRHSRFVVSAMFLAGVLPQGASLAAIDWNQRLSELEQRLDRAGSEEERFTQLDSAAQAAFQTGNLDKARQWSDESLRLADRHRDSWNYGNAVHRGHLLRGHFALRAGDVQEAARELLVAADTPGSPQLATFGPNMSLAKVLLEQGQREAVLEYLDKCARFWEMGAQQIVQWSAEIGKGGIPDFGANLSY